MMMGFGWWFLALATLALMFVAWPLLSKRSKRQEQIESLGDEVAGRVAFNDALFAEQLQELDDQLGHDEISQAQYEKLKSELELQNQQDIDIDASTGRPIFSTRGHAFLAAIAVVLPLLGYLVYLQLGAADDVKIQRLNDQLVVLQQGGESASTQAVSRELFEVLDRRLKKRPDNLNNRFLMARTAVEMRDFPRAIESYRYILERQPNSPAVLGEMAQVLFIAAGNRFTPEVQQLFDKALQLEPNNGELLGFAGLAAYQSGQYQAALDYWKQGQSLLEAEDPRYQSWEDAIAQARSQMQASGQEEEKVASEQDVSLQVAVSLPEGLQVPGDTAVFVYARAWQGPKAPLAMQRLKVADLPTVIGLEESMSMVPGMTMSRFPQLEIVARVSLAGTAEPQPGDWQGSYGPVESRSSSEPLSLVIDSQVP